MAKLISIRVSRDLYEDSSHFILEFIQNADDNKYRPTDNPTLRFHLLRSKLIVECNEKGFTERDIRALCHLGDSSKQNSDSSKKNKIGEKGIG